jgi:hypothetical protein
MDLSAYFHDLLVPRLDLLDFEGFDRGAIKCGGVPYWAVIAVSATACWGTLFLVLPVATPAIEILGKSVTEAIWRFGVEGSMKEGTLWPFGKELLLGRLGADPHVSADEGLVVESRFSGHDEGRNEQM